MSLAKTFQEVIEETQPMVEEMAKIICRSYQKIPLRVTSNVKCLHAFGEPYKVEAFVEVWTKNTFESLTKSFVRPWLISRIELTWDEASQGWTAIHRFFTNAHLISRYAEIAISQRIMHTIPNPSTATLAGCDLTVIPQSLLGQLVKDWLIAQPSSVIRVETQRGMLIHGAVDYDHIEGIFTHTFIYQPGRLTHAIARIIYAEDRNLKEAGSIPFVPEVQHALDR